MTSLDDEIIIKTLLGLLTSLALTETIRSSYRVDAVRAK